MNPNQFGYHTDYYYFAYYLRGSYEVHYICYDRDRDRIELAGVKVIYLNFPRYRVFRSIYFLARTLIYMRSAEFDFVIANYFPVVALIGLIAGSRRTILDIRSGSLKPNAFSRKCGNLNIRLASAAFDLTTILSDGLAEVIKLKRYTLLPLGSDSYFAGDHVFDKLKLLYVGSLEQRRIHETVEGLSLFLNANTEASVTYDIVGFGDEKDVRLIMDAIRNNHVENIVSLHGRKTLGELSSFFEICNVGVSYVPITPWYDNQPPTKTFEYILSGMICVGTSTGENKKYISPTNGVLCNDSAEEFAQALAWLWKNRNSFNSCQVRQTLSDYTWERIVELKLRPLLVSVAT